MGRRLALLFAPLAIASTLLMASPGQALAANGMTETGTTTYEVVPGQSQIKVTVTISVANHKPSDAVYFYYWDQTSIAVEKEAGTVSVTSNAGKVSQKVIKSDTYYRYLQLDYPRVLYGQTRVVTATYTIPAAPKSPGGFRALSAYASLCAAGNGEDTGSLSIVLPAGFELFVDSGADLTRSTDKSGKLVYSTGTQGAPYKLWTCVDAENSGKLMSSQVTASKQPFTLQSWPEDKAWSDEMKADLAKDVPALEKLTGLTMPGSKVTIIEAGDEQLGDYSGSFNADTNISYIPETIDKATVAHELSHLWFNKKTLKDKWMSEGLAGYSEQAAGAGNFTACAAPGTYPGTGDPNLMDWKILTGQPTKADQQIVDYEYKASCYIFSNLAGKMGADNFKDVLVAAAADTMAYQGGKKDERLDGAGLPLTSRQMLDLIDEIGMVPAGVEDLDVAGDMLMTYGIFDGSELDARSTARSNYHTLLTSAKTWEMPLAVREPMATWDFANATSVMSTIQQIFKVRDQIQTTVKGLTLDGTQIEKDFEAAETEADLQAVLALAKKEAGAAGVVARAITTHDASRSFLQSVGLMGVDVDTKLKAAQTDLAAVKPDTATAEAQSVIDTIDKAGDQGTLRVGMAVGGFLVVLLLLVALIVLLRRRGRKAALATAPAGFPAMAGYGGPMMPLDPNQSFGYQQQTSAWGQPQGQTPQAGQWPAAPPIPQAPAWPPAPPQASAWPPAGQAPEWPSVAPQAPAWPTAPPAAAAPAVSPAPMDLPTPPGAWAQPPAPPFPTAQPLPPQPTFADATWNRAAEPAAQPLAPVQPIAPPQPLAPSEPLASAETLAPMEPSAPSEPPASAPDWPQSSGSDPSSSS